MSRRDSFVKALNDGNMRFSVTDAAKEANANMLNVIPKSRERDNLFIMKRDNIRRLCIGRKVKESCVFYVNLIAKIDFFH